jgi:Fe-S-cluster containining protein
MEAVNLRSFRNKVLARKRKMKLALSRIEKNPPRGLDKTAVTLEKEVWQEIDCLTCANCCKKMTPTFTEKDIRRISAHLDMTPSAFKEKWLYKDSIDDWLNKSLPCQFLDTKTNMCNIYAVRPDDCAGFPHLSKKKFITYIDTHKQNIEYCPATFSMVEKMMELAMPGKK